MHVRYVHQHQLYKLNEKFFRDLVPTLLKICSETKEQLKFFKLAGHIFTDLDLKWKEVSFLRVWLLYYEFFRTANHLLFLPAEAAAYLISYVLNMDVTLSYQRASIPQKKKN